MERNHSLSRVVILVLTLLGLGSNAKAETSPYGPWLAGTQPPWEAFGGTALGQWTGMYMGALQIMSQWEQIRHSLQAAQTGHKQDFEQYRKVQLGSRCLADEECAPCAERPVKRVNDAYEVLENNRVKHTHKMTLFDLYHNAATSINNFPGAGLASIKYQFGYIKKYKPLKDDWTKRVKEAQHEALMVLRENLAQIGRCEIEYLHNDTFFQVGRNTAEIMWIKYAL